MLGFIISLPFNDAEYSAMSPLFQEETHGIRETEMFVGCDYKTACEFCTTREHDDYSVIASEFCDFLSSILTYLLINKFDSSRLLKIHSYGDNYY